MDAPPTEEDDVAGPNGGVSSAVTLLNLVPGSGVVDDASKDGPNRFDASKSLRSNSRVEGGGCGEGSCCCDT